MATRICGGAVNAKSIVSCCSRASSLRWSADGMVSRAAIASARPFVRMTTTTLGENGSKAGIAAAMAGAVAAGSARGLVVLSVTCAMSFCSRCVS